MHFIVSSIADKGWSPESRFLGWSAEYGDNSGSVTEFSFVVSTYSAASGLARSARHGAPLFMGITLGERLGGVAMKLGDYLRCLRLNISVALREFYKGRQIAHQDCLAPRAHDSPLFPLREQAADGEQCRAGQLREFLT
jgi:hypothetical protein